VASTIHQSLLEVDIVGAPHVVRQLVYQRLADAGVASEPLQVVRHVAPQVEIETKLRKQFITFKLQTL